MINKTCPLVLSDLYEYDFSACAYRILQSIGWDLSGVPFEDKEKRNIQIGYIQRDNPRVSAYLQLSIQKLVDHYLRENHVVDEELILRQKDGMTVKRRLEKTNTSMPIELRGVISKLIIDVSRKRWLILYMDGRVVAKGVPKKTKNMAFFENFRNLDFSSKKNLISGLELMRQRILSSSEVSWFLQEDEDGSLVVPLKNVGYIRINESAVSSISPKDIERSFLWDEFLWPFVETILVHCS